MSRPSLGKFINRQNRTYHIVSDSNNNRGKPGKCSSSKCETLTIIMKSLKVLKFATEISIHLGIWSAENIERGLCRTH